MTPDLTPSDPHNCISHIEPSDPDWVVFTCPLCPTYVRRINWKTGEMTTKGWSEANHVGFNVPLEVKINQN